MNHSLETAYYAYHQQIKVLKKVGAGSGEQIDDKEIFSLLRQRDLIQAFIDRSTDRTNPVNIPSQLLLNLSEDDAKVGRWTPNLLEVEALFAWRKSCNPPAHHWWWYPEADQGNSWMEWFLGGLTIALLVICLALARDISARFLMGASGIWSSVGIIAPAALALFATGGALTRVGKQFIDTILSKRWKSPVHRAWVKTGLALLVTAVFGLGHFPGLPLAATYFNSQGRQHYDEGRLASAQANFQRALKLNPELLEANHG